jgi:GrpB-like predicted nucleotidyltransferase (UPF0157 family)
MLVEIVDPDPAWPRAFDALRDEIARTPGAVAIEHVGSTSVRGLAAKPVIDVMIGVRDASILDANGDEPWAPTNTHSLACAGSAAHVALVEFLTARGFVYRSHADLPEQLLLRRDVSGRRAHHLHVARIGSAYWDEHLLFRDYLRAHAPRAHRYGELKREIARVHRESVPYMHAKSAFIAETLALARAWRAATAASPAR